METAECIEASILSPTWAASITVGSHSSGFFIVFKTIDHEEEECTYFGSTSLGRRGNNVPLREGYLQELYRNGYSFA